MDGINKKYNIVLDVLTPLAIGAGAEKDWMLGMDYVVKDGYLYKLSLQKIAQEGADFLSKLTTCFERKDSDGVLRLIGHKLESVSDGKMMLPCHTANDVKAFVKNQLTGKPIIPGSSIKGAIRSILLEYLTQDANGVREDLRNGQRRESSIFGEIANGTDFMRFVKFGDFEFDETKLINTKIFNLQEGGANRIGGWKHGSENTNETFRQQGFNTVYEAIAPHMQGTGYLMLSETGFNRLEGNQSYAEKKAKVLTSPNDIPVTLFKIVNDHTKSYLMKELSFFTKYSADKTPLIVEGIERLLEAVEAAQKDNSYCIFKMSAGSGFHSITGDWQFGDYSINDVRPVRRGPSRGLYNGRESSKSRKIAIYDNGQSFSLMGFVKMSVMNAEQIAAWEQALQEEMRKKEEEAEYRKREEEKARERVAAEARTREEEQRRQQERHAAYEAAINKAESNFRDANQEDIASLKNALDLFEKAENVFPDGTRHGKRIKDIEERIQELEKKATESAIRQQSIDAGLSILEDKNVNGEYKVTLFKHVRDRAQSWMKKAKISALPGEQDKYLIETLGRLAVHPADKKERQLLTDFSSPAWKSIVAWCGLERARAIFEKVTTKS